MEIELSRVVIDALPGLVWTARPNGEVDFLSQGWREYTGLPFDKAGVPAWQNSIHPEDLPKLRETLQAIVDSAAPGETQARLRRSDGAYRWFLFKMSPLADPSGTIMKWCGINTDIDDRKRAEALLAGEKQLLEMVVSGQPLPLILDTLCRLVEAAADGCYCSVMATDETGARLEHAAAPSLPASVITAIIGQPVNAGSDPDAMVSAQARWSTPIRSSTGKTLGAFAIHSDPTPHHRALVERFKHIASIAIERMQGDAALQRSKAFLAETRRLSATGGITKRVATGEIRWSREVYRMFDFDPAIPLTLELIQARVHPEDRISFREMLDRQQRGTDYEHEYRLLMPDATVKYLHVVAHATRGQDGELEYIAAVQDVSQRRLSEQALAKARSDLAHVARVTSLGALTASIAHEVNQPLSGIITNAGTCLRMLAADPPNIDGARETARRTIRDGNRASDVIKRLHALFAKQAASVEPVNLNHAAQEVIALSLTELQRNRIILQTEYAEDLPPVTGDRVQLQQVILNLLLNASDAMANVHDRPRRLLIRTEQYGRDQVRVTVQDSGSGFDPQHADRLFDAFYTTKIGGMGIGLSVSRAIIENHQGHLSAAPNDGPGAAFSFSIPRQPDQVTGRFSLGAMWTSAVVDTHHAGRPS